MNFTDNSVILHYRICSWNFPKVFCKSVFGTVFSRGCTLPFIPDRPSLPSKRRWWKDSSSFSSPSWGGSVARSNRCPRPLNDPNSHWEVINTLNERRVSEWVPPSTAYLPHTVPPPIPRPLTQSPLPFPRPPCLVYFDLVRPCQCVFVNCFTMFVLNVA